MFEEKESWWKRNGFYFSACVLVLGIMVAGVIFYQKNSNNGSNKMLAEIATEVPEQTSDAKGNQQDTAQVNANVTARPAETRKDNSTTVENNAKNTSNPAEISGAKKTKKDSARKAEKAAKEKKADEKQKEKKAAAASTNTSKNYTFNEEKGLLWPVKGDVILKYSMTKTVYFKTLAQYKYNPGIVISAKKGSDVKAAAAGKVLAVKKDDELGNLVTVDIGDEYQVTYGQLTDVSVKKGDAVKEGQSIGKIAEPTKYYTEEGSNLFFQVKEGKETVDPLLLLR